MDGTEIVLAITKELNATADGIHRKIEGLRCEFNDHRGACIERFVQIETSIKVKDAVNGVEEKTDAKRRDWGKWFVRVALGAIALWAITEMLEKFVKT